MNVPPKGFREVQTTAEARASAAIPDSARAALVAATQNHTKAVAMSSAYTLIHPRERALRDAAALERAGVDYLRGYLTPDPLRKKRKTTFAFSVFHPITLCTTLHQLCTLISMPSWCRQHKKPFCEHPWSAYRSDLQRSLLIMRVTLLFTAHMYTLACAFVYACAVRTHQLRFCTCQIYHEY